MVFHEEIILAAAHPIVDQELVHIGVDTAAIIEIERRQSCEDCWSSLRARTRRVARPTPVQGAFRLAGLDLAIQSYFAPPAPRRSGTTLPSPSPASAAAIVPTTRSATVRDESAARC